MPVFFGDLAAPASPGVRLRVGTGPVRLCCAGPAGPALLNDFYPAASTTIDQATGGTYTTSGGAPTFAAGLGGVLYMKDGVVYTPALAGGFPAAGISQYWLIVVEPGFTEIYVGGLVRFSPPAHEHFSVGIQQFGVPQRVLASVVSPAGNTGFGTQIAPLSTKIVLSAHLVVNSPTTATVELRLNGAVFVPPGQPFSINPYAVDQFVAGGDLLFPGGNNQPATGVQIYRGQLYDTGIYDPAIDAALLALLP
jgi:hypothetical protein